MLMFIPLAKVKHRTMNTCTVSSLIAFEAEESPKWRKKTKTHFPAVNEMVKRIVKYKNEWEKRKDSIDETTLDEVKLYFLREYVFANLNDGPGSVTKKEVESCLDVSIPSSQPLSKNEKKIVNLRDAYDLLLGAVKEVEDSGEVKKVEDNDEVKKIEDSDEVKKIEDSGEVNKIEDSDEVKKIEDNDEVKKIEDSDEVNKIEHSDEVKKTEHSDEVKKIEDSDELKKIEDSDEVKKIEDSGEVKKTEDSDEIKKIEVSEEVKKVEDIEKVKKVEDSEAVKKVTGSDEVKKCYGLLEINLVKNVHKLVLKDIEQSANKTKPGEFSKNKRVTKFKGEEYEYPTPENMEKEVQTLLDRYNDLINCVKEEKDSEVLVYKMFKSCSWLLFELLDLHPFANGNGRLCRLFCSYALSFITPFPTPIYNVWTESCKDDYRQALVDARKSEDRHPTSLTTMIIECNYSGWKKLFEFLDDGY